MIVDVQMALDDETTVTQLHVILVSLENNLSLRVVLCHWVEPIDAAHTANLLRKQTNLSDSTGTESTRMMTSPMWFIQISPLYSKKAIVNFVAINRESVQRVNQVYSFKSCNTYICGD